MTSNMKISIETKFIELYRPDTPDIEPTNKSLFQIPN
jgi:hypothetical protein